MESFIWQINDTVIDQSTNSIILIEYSIKYENDFMPFNTYELFLKIETNISNENWFSLNEESQIELIKSILTSDKTYTIENLISLDAKLFLLLNENGQFIDDADLNLINSFNRYPFSQEFIDWLLSNPRPAMPPAIQ